MNKSSKMSRIEASIILLVGCSIFLAANASEESSLETITYEWDTNLKLLNRMGCLFSPPFSTWNRTEVEKWQFEICLAPYGKLEANLHHRSPSHIKVDVELLIINQEYENATIVALAPDMVFNGWFGRTVGRIPYLEQDGFVMKNRIRIAARIQSDQIPINNREEPTTISYKWDVSLDSLKLANGQDIYSPEFLALINGQQTVWRIQLYPNGEDSSSRSVTIYLQYRGKTAITTICDITLVNAEPEFSFRRYHWGWDFHQYSQFLLGMGFPFSLQYSRCGYQGAISKEALTEKNGFVFGNNFRIEVRLPADSRSLNDLESESSMIPFTWEVKKTDLQLSTGQYLLSPNITTWKGKSKETWQVSIYPNGFSSDYSDHVSLFLAHRGDNKVKSKWTLSIVNSDVKKTESRSGTSNFEYDLNAFGSESFIKKTLLNDPAKGFLVDDKIKISVELPSDTVMLPFPQPVNALSPTTASINATLQNLYREFKVKTPNGLEFSINHIMSFESIEKLMTSLVQLSCKSSN